MANEGGSARFFRAGGNSAKGLAGVSACKSHGFQLLMR